MDNNNNIECHNRPYIHTRLCVVTDGTITTTTTKKGVIDFVSWGQSVGAEVHKCVVGNFTFKIKTQD